MSHPCAAKYHNTTLQFLPAPTVWCLHPQGCTLFFIRKLNGTLIFINKGNPGLISIQISMSSLVEISPWKLIKMSSNLCKSP